MFIKDSNIWKVEKKRPFCANEMSSHVLLILANGLASAPFFVFQLLCRLVWNHSNGPRNSLIRIMQKWQRKWLWITLEINCPKRKIKIENVSEVVRLWDWLFFSHAQ